MMVIIMMTVIVSDGADVDHVRVDVDNDDRVDVDDCDWKIKTIMAVRKIERFSLNIKKNRTI